MLFSLGRSIGTRFEKNFCSAPSLVSQWNCGFLLQCCRQILSLFVFVDVNVLHFKHYSTLFIFRWRENRKTHLNFRLQLFRCLRCLVVNTLLDFSLEQSTACAALLTSPDSASFLSCFDLELWFSLVQANRFFIHHFSSLDSPEAFLAMKFSCPSSWWVSLALQNIRKCFSETVWN